MKGVPGSLERGRTAEPGLEIALGRLVGARNLLRWPNCASSYAHSTQSNPRLTSPCDSVLQAESVRRRTRGLQCHSAMKRKRDAGGRKAYGSPSCSSILSHSSKTKCFTFLASKNLSLVRALRRPGVATTICGHFDLSRRSSASFVTGVPP